jgi:hypothetical protein
LPGGPGGHPSKNLMTWRAIVIGLIGVLTICGFGYLNDRILELESINNGHQLPILVVGLLIVTVLLIHPLIALLRRPRRLSPAELAVIGTFCACACGISGRALAEQFAQLLVLPHHWERITPGWQTHRLLDYAPKRLMVDPEPQDEVVNRFLTGSTREESDSATFWQRCQKKIAQTPWRQWRAPLVTWMPIFTLGIVIMTALAIVTHRQWSAHEHLQYPIANFMGELIRQDGDSWFNSTLRNRLFWLGFVIFFLIRLNNGLYQWYPETIIPIKLNHSLWPFASKWPALLRNPRAGGLLNFNIFPLVIGVGFLLSSEISFTLGMTQILWACFCIPVIGLGFNLATDYEIGGWRGWQRAGSYIAFAAILLYAGRHAYWETFKRAFGLRPPRSQLPSPSAPERAAVIAMRVLIVSTIALCLLIIRLGLTWPIAIGLVFLLLVTYLVVARISAETGLFFIQPGWQPFGMLMALFGSYAMGPTPIVIAAFVCIVLCLDPCHAMIPYLVNGLKLGERGNVRPSTLAWSNLALYMLGALVAVFAVLVLSYDFGTPAQYHWSYKRIPTLPFRAAQPALMQLKAIGALEASEGLSGWERLLAIRPSSSFLWAIAFGIIGVLAFSFLRLRTRWWPLHPCLFLLWETYPLSVMSHPFLVGWLLKKICLRFGGNRLVVKLKPFAVGVISADIMGALVFMAVGLIYYLYTGEKPKTYRYFPR